MHDKGRWDKRVKEKGRESYRKAREKNGNGREKRQQFLYLATQKATTKLVNFLINSTGLKKSFENRGNFKL